ncbi:MAG: cob(I)yrinic acid a,c-diamide adenosyltransferase [Candidatus Peregrinibacteria bacterium]|nr:cob(I)yrinic acid a,c-diamide adenosyltransferase [Candidatus Peregrinibacteria bacterium]
MAPRETGLIQVYTGNGKGKTTAALGLALRARAAEKRVAIVFFDKGGEHYSERKILQQLGVEWFGYGMDRIDSKTNRFRFGVLAEDTAQAEQGIAKAMELVRGGYDLLILDEINSTVALGMVSEKSVERLIEVKPDTLELVLTGRTEVAHGKIIRPSYFDRADLMTEMRLEKHYFYHGIPAREGIDF